MGGWEQGPADAHLFPTSPQGRKWFVTLFSLPQILPRGPHCPLEVSPIPTPSGPMGPVQPQSLPMRLSEIVPSQGPQAWLVTRVVLPASKGRRGKVTMVVLTHCLFQTAEHFQKVHGLPKGAGRDTPVLHRSGSHTLQLRDLETLVLNFSVQ